MVVITVGEPVMLQSHQSHQSHQSDNLIVVKLKHSLGAEACSVAGFLVLLQELDSCRGWARLGYASLFDFCHVGLNLIRAESYSRTRLARLAGDVPQVISLLKSEAVSLSVLRILAPVLTAENFNEVLAAIRGKSTREVEDFRNAFRPADNAATRGLVRTIFSSDKTSIGAVSGAAPVAAPAAVVMPASIVAPAAALVIPTDQADVSQPVAMIGAPSRAMQRAAEAAAPRHHVQKSVRMSMTLNNEVWDKYQRACNLSNHSASGGDVAAMMEMLLDDYLKHHDVVAKKRASKEEKQESGRARRAKVENADVAAAKVKAAGVVNLEVANEKVVAKCENEPVISTKHSRYIPKSIRRKVRVRDAEQCSYVDAATGRRCECKRGLQYDHILPFAHGGVSTSSQNLRLLCSAHNRLAAENIFGLEFMSTKIRNSSEELKS